MAEMIQSGVFHVGAFVFFVSLLVGFLLSLFAGFTNRQKKGKGFSGRKVQDRRIPVNEDLITASGEQHSNKNFMPKE